MSAGIPIMSQLAILLEDLGTHDVPVTVRNFWSGNFDPSNLFRELCNRFVMTVVYL